MSFYLKKKFSEWKVSDLSPIRVGRMLTAQIMSQYQIAQIVRVSRSTVQRIKRKVDLMDGLRGKCKKVRAVVGES